MLMRFLSKVCLIVLVIIIFQPNVYSSVPVALITLTLKQPNGLIFKAYPKGNVYSNWIETESQHSIVKKNGVWYYAVKNSNQELEASKSQVGQLNQLELNRLPKSLKPDIKHKIEQNTTTQNKNGHAQNNSNLQLNTQEQMQQQPVLEARLQSTINNFGIGI